MILELRNITPFIEFGFNKTSKQTYKDVKVDVYLKTLYNEQEYNDISVTSIGGTIVEISPYHYEITYTSLGTYNVSIEIINKDKKITLTSNTLSVEVVCRNNYVFSDSCNSQYLPNL